MSIATICTCKKSLNGYCNSRVKECTQLGKMEEKKEYYPGISYKELSDYLQDNHNLVLIESEMQELIQFIHESYTHPLMVPENKPEIEWDSERVIGRVKDRFKELEEKKWDWRSFFNGWLEGRSDMLAQIKGLGKYKK